jgi:hypothetical protein
MSLDQAGTCAPTLLARKTTVLTDAATRLPRLGLRGVTGRTLAAPLLTRDEARARSSWSSTRARAGPRDERDRRRLRRPRRPLPGGGLAAAQGAPGAARATAVARITRMAASRHEPESLLQAVAPELMAASGADRVVLYLKAPRPQVLTAVAWAGTTPEEEEQIARHTLEPATPSAAPAQGSARPLPGRGQPAARPAPPVRGSDVPPRSCPWPCATSSWARSRLVSTRRYVHFDGPAIEFLGDIAQQVALGVENAPPLPRPQPDGVHGRADPARQPRRFTEALRRELGARGARPALSPWCSWTSIT